MQAQVTTVALNTPEGKAFVDKILSRQETAAGGYEEIAAGIVSDVAQNGDKALFKYTKQYDHISLTPETIKMTTAQMDEAISQVDETLYQTLLKAASRIRCFHEKQRQNSWLEPMPNGEMLGQMVRPLQTVGVYVPGGKAAYPSTVLMNTIPAKVAGVLNVVMATPCNKDGSVSPVVVAAARIAGVDALYQIGGAQAIAAMAYGTESVPRVDKIVGPGNIFVALAKKKVFGQVDIDSVAGPSEILIVADDSANPDYVAADMLSQAEHDEMASALLVTHSTKLAQKVGQALLRLCENAPRKDIIMQSLTRYGGILITQSQEESVRFVNQFAPEHLEICTSNPHALLGQIQNAGAIFLGNYSPEPLGDYMAGPNHVLPTGGTARFYSPLAVDDFIKKSSVICFSEDALLALSDDVIRLAEAEGLYAHAKAVSIRKEQQ